jgi:hypothetical protein|tara:strand:+ start:297 stop:797 length:501 start_codon:yes stop_codon:yes gene_type:complete
MPNHTSNKLAVSGPTSEVERFKLENKSKEETLSLEKSLPTPSEMLGDNAIKSGNMPAWYSWRVENWGTKWDIYDSLDWENDPYGNSVVRFFSAWSPPTPWLKAIAEKYPDLSFYLTYADEGGSFVGATEAQGLYGEAVSDHDWDSEEGIAIRSDLGYDHDLQEEEN